MTPEQIAQAKAWTRLRGWRRMPGMRAVIPGLGGGGRVVADGKEVMEPDEEFYIELSCFDIVPGSVPDVTDPATIGCLVQLVREITGLHATYADTWKSARVEAAVVLHNLEQHAAGQMYTAPTLAAALLKAAQAWEADHD